MTALIVLEAVAIVLLGLLVAGLLRSHAEILRRLHELDGGGQPDFRVSEGVAAPSESSASGHDIAGVTPDGDAIVLGVAGAAHRTLLAFLSSGCSTCASFWEAFQDEDSLSLPQDTRLAIVTKDPQEERPSAVADLAPGHVPVVMSSAAWADYGVPGSPYVVFVDGPTSRVVGEGAAATWRQVTGLLADAVGDARGGRKRRGRTQAGRGEADRADRVDRELAAAGIGPGHPSLYPAPEAEETGKPDTGHGDTGVPPLR